MADYRDCEKPQVLKTMDLSKNHLSVLKALQDILCDVIGCRSSQDIETTRLNFELQQAELERQRKPGKNKAIDSKVSKLEKQLQVCAQPILPQTLESELMRSFTHGPMKLSDVNRWQVCI